MEKYSEMIGLPVICVEDGKKIGIIKDVLFSTKNREVTGFLLDKKSYECHEKVIPMEDVRNVGKDALVIDHCRVVHKINKKDKLDPFCHRHPIKGLRIFTRSGQDLGVVNDVLFDAWSGKIEGVEVSDGILQDIYRGRKILPLFGKVEFAEENILVDREAVEEMTGTGGGIKNKYLNADKEKL